MSIDVTVIIPVHNTGRGVLAGLESLRAQTLPRSRFEVIYVDDGSTDGTGELLDTELAGEENFSVVHIENSGWPGRPRNIGIDRARGEYLFFMDDDDYLGAEALERLVAKAREDSADIVIGRMAGIGRRAPREIFQRPLSGATLRTHRILLTTLTVHKLFRTEFVRSHGLRFPEGKVRLEDHMFMLPAYLRAASVSVVHDYTCYYWVRHKDENFGNISFRTPPDPEDYLGSVERIIDIIEAETEPGEFRDTLLAQWYRSKLLGQMQGAKYLRLPEQTAEVLHTVAHSLVQRRIPERVDARLNPFSRLRATALRTGQFDLVRHVAEFEHDLGQHTTVTGYRWDGSVLYVDVESTLVRKSDQRPLEFVRSAESVYWDLPTAVLSHPEVCEAAEVTAALKRIKLRTFARNKKLGSDVTVPTSFTLLEEPVGADRFTVRLVGTVTLDIQRGNLGGPLLGKWWFVSRIDLGGVSCDFTLGPLRSPAAEATRVPAFVHLDNTPPVLVTPSYNAKNHLVVTADDPWQKLPALIPPQERPAVVRNSDGLQLRIPLALHTSDERIGLPLCLVGNGEKVESAASVRPDSASATNPHSVLTADVPHVSGPGQWELVVETAERPIPLRLRLSRGLFHWSVKVQHPSRSLRARMGRLYRALRRRAGRLARDLGLRR